MRGQRGCRLTSDIVPNHMIFPSLQMSGISLGSFRIERTERRTAYENMMDALIEEDSTFQVDLPIRRHSVSFLECCSCNAGMDRER